MNEYEEDWDDDEEIPAAVKAWQNRQESVAGETENWYDLISHFFTFLEGLSHTFEQFFNSVSGWFSSKSMDHDEKRVFAREASQAIESITEGNDG